MRKNRNMSYVWTTQVWFQADFLSAVDRQCDIWSYVYEIVPENLREKDVLFCQDQKRQMQMEVLDFAEVII